MTATLERTEVGAPAGPDLAEAARFCRRMARHQAANFYWGFIALPPDRRTAVYALYDFARQVDDDVDGVDRDEATVRIAVQRERLRRALDGDVDDPVMAVLRGAVLRFGIPAAELEALVDGVETDLTTTRYPTWDALSGYCSLVASTVGRMCVRIFGFDHARALDDARTLGLALQLTNILRDVREDAGMGRIYLPLDELAMFGVGEREVLDGVASPRWTALVRYQARRAGRLFDSGLTVTDHIPRRAAVCVHTMAGIYRRILVEVDRDPALPLRRRLSLPATTKARVMLEAWAAGGGVRR